jgi:hypothetical protein
MHATGGLGAVLIPHDDLAEHRVVVHRDLGAFLEIAVG